MLLAHTVAAPVPRAAVVLVGVFADDPVIWSLALPLVTVALLEPLAVGGVR
jgi:hypothetical protein